MLNRRIALAAFALCAFAAPSLAADRQAFEAKAFQAAQTAGRSILVEVTAPWCSVCAKQKPIIGALEKKPEFAGLSVFTIDFDSQKELLRTLRVNSQSTLISYKGAKEIARSVGVSDPAAIEKQLRSAL
jgi:thiol-disulfide isomerase/thioredoxin